MIFGHLGAAAMVRAVRREPTGTIAFLALCAASVVPDVVDIVYVLAGICSPYGLYSHTIPAVVVETAIVGGIALLVTDSWRVAVSFAVLVPLHLAADFLTMHKLLMPGGEIVGLDLYRRPTLDFLVEAPAIIGGWWLLRRSRHGPDWAVTWRMVAVVLSLQAGLDGYGAWTNKAIKPNVCPVLSGTDLRSDI